MASPLAPATLVKLRRRLIPFLFLLYIVSYLDRINVGFAALQMNEALGFDASTFGLGAGIFFLGYVVFEVPSNVILARVGARLWIARIMISWGVVSSAMMFVRGSTSFYGLRLLLGIAEAGFFPGIIFYLTRWFPAPERARAIALFMTATIVAGVVGGPISGALLSMHGMAGLAGWQWLFLLEGLPAVILGVVVLRYLPDGPRDARWLDEGERAALEQTLRDEPQARAHTLGAALRSGRVWLLAGVYFAIPVGLYAVSFWLPQIVKASSRASDFDVGLLSTIPYLLAVVATVVVGRHSDRTGERRWHVALSALVGCVGFVAAGFATGLATSLLTLSLAMIGIASMFGPFWSLATSFVSGTGAAAGIALVNSVGNIGGFVGPYLVGFIKDATHSFAAGLIAIGVMFALSGLLVLAGAPNEPGRPVPEVM